MHWVGKRLNLTRQTSTSHSIHVYMQIRIWVVKRRRLTRHVITLDSVFVCGVFPGDQLVGDLSFWMACVSG